MASENGNRLYITKNKLLIEEIINLTIKGLGVPYINNIK